MLVNENKKSFCGIVYMALHANYVWGGQTLKIAHHKVAFPVYKWLQAKHRASILEKKESQLNAVEKK